VKAQSVGYAVNIVLALQVIVGALITGIAAAAAPESSRISTSVLGGISTLIAGFLARVRGSGEPELSKEKIEILEKVSFLLFPNPCFYLILFAMSSSCSHSKE
jgi:SMODS and SLOG-associating 2TM effector domain